MQPQDLTEIVTVEENLALLASVGSASGGGRAKGTPNILGLQPRGGTLSYSELPGNHAFTFGMSSTLNCLSATQNCILKEFGFSFRTEIPSTFKKQTLCREETQVLEEKENQFFDTICAVATDKCMLGKAVLVILENKTTVEAFQKHIKDSGKELPDKQIPLELTGKTGLKIASCLFTNRLRAGKSLWLLVHMEEGRTLSAMVLDSKKSLEGCT